MKPEDKYPSPAGRSARAASLTVVVGLSLPEAQSLPSGLIARDWDVVSTTPQALGAELVRRAELVVSPVLSDNVDAMEIAQTLTDAGFSGRYCAVSDKMPDPSLIEREVRRRFKKLNFEIIA